MMTELVKPAPKDRGRVFPPSVWVCPLCGTRVVTHIHTYPVECASAKHSRTRVVMEATSEDN